MSPVQTLTPFAHGGQAHAAEPLERLLPALVLIGGSALYLAAAAAYRSRRWRAWSRWRTASWLTGVGLVALALSPALTGAAGGARAHMTQHLLLGMFAPLGLVAGAPLTLVLGVSSRRTGRALSAVLRHPVCHVVAHPVTAAVLNVGGMLALYLTPLYAASQQHALFHHLVHAHFLAAGYLFTWAVAGPDPAPRRPALRTRVVVLVLAAGAHSWLGKLLYARADELPPGSGHGVAEVQEAAQLMYYGGDVAELFLATLLFAAWYRHAGRQARRAQPAAATLT